MAVTEEVAGWSKTAGSNGNIDSGINAAEGQTPGSVNNAIRGVMAAVAKWRDDIGGQLTTAGTSTAYTLTTNQVIDALADGLHVAAVINATNTGASTLAVDSTGAKAILRNGGDGMVAVTAGELVIQTHATFRYDASAASAAGAWIWVDPLSNVGLFRAPDIILREQQTANTAGGTFTSGARRTSVLNTEVRDVRGECALASNQFTLTAGTYYIRWRRPAFRCDFYKSWLVNATDTADIIIGGNAFSANAASYCDNHSFGEGTFTIAASKALEIQARCTTTQATNGFGNLTNLDTEVYTVVELWRMA